jgi:PAS domain S-box-containing protein
MPALTMSAMSPWRRFWTTFTIAAILCAGSVGLAATSGTQFPNSPARASGVVRSAAAAALIAVQGLLIGALLLQRVRRRRAERALRHSEARQAATLKAMPDLMFLIGKDGVYLDYHARDPSLLFVPPDQFIGKRIADVMPPPLAALFMRELARARDASEPNVIEYSLPIDGEERHYETRLVPCERDTILTIVRDITVRKRTEAALGQREVELRQTNERNRHLAGRLIASQEAERQRIARELHDDLSQRLALLKVDLEQLRATRAATATEIDARVKMISDQTTEIAGEVRRLSHQLHPARLQALGLVAAVDAMCRETSRQHGIAVEFTHNEIPRRVDPDLALCLYRITQEALHNIVRHSGTTRASVGLRHDHGDLGLQIEDRGSGFVRPDVGHAGLGLVSMRERVAFLKGTIDIHSVPGEGTRIEVCVPCPDALLRPQRPAAESA